MENSETLFTHIATGSLNRRAAAISSRLAHKISYKSAADMEALSDLALLLYINGDTDSAKRVCGLTDGLVFSNNFNVWSFIHSIRGLKSRILREEGKGEQAESIIAQIEADHLTPGKLMDREAKQELRLRIKNRTTYNDLASRDKIEQAPTPAGAAAYRFSALKSMILCREMDGYPLIDKDKLEEGIKDYTAELLRLSAYSSN
ncbi:DUF6707 family protein [Paenibacillus sp. S150]|uniref:DUF6707 family protein n=1 Tax=Paenibacillus sp. S150 TaxID=2749826 RepID=UPI001C59CB67|nr:DUF6707 family protein [Paenibacillus sp. S150]MBW4085022.1 hypothetical protein [Paenibacillus sp. S150]